MSPHANKQQLPTHAVPDPMSAPPLRWGVLGLGKIARSFATALHEGTRQVVQAVGSRERERAAEFAEANGVATAHESYEDLVADPQVDVVYVASPHSEHLAHALLAIEAGKPVLVEKAFARNTGEAQRILDAAAEGNVFCAEAMWSRFLPHYDVVRRAVADGVIGPVASVVADNGARLYPDGPQRLADPALAGGSLLDLGVYPVSLAQMLLGDAEFAGAEGTLTDLGVDANIRVTLTAGGSQHAVAECTSDMTQMLPTMAVVTGTRGQLVIEGRFYQPNRVRLLDLDGVEIDAFTPLDTTHGLRYEAAEAARCITAGRTSTPYMTHEDTLAVMRLMDAARAAVGVSYPGESA